MRPREWPAAAGRWLVGPHGLMLFAVSLLFVLMVASFVNVPWNLPSTNCSGGSALCDIPVKPEGGPDSITGLLFGDYVFLVVLSALVLAACMIGGVYLAKTEGGP